MTDGSSNTDSTSASKPPYTITTTGNVPVQFEADSWEAKAIAVIRRIRATHKDAVILFRSNGEILIYCGEKVGRIPPI